MTRRACSCLTLALFTTLTTACLGGGDNDGGGYYVEDGGSDNRESPSRGSGDTPLQPDNGNTPNTPDAGTPDEGTTDTGVPDTQGPDEGPPVFDSGPSPDTGPEPDVFGPDTGAAGCGDLTIEGECVGTTLRYCDETGQLQEYDCATVFPAGEATGTCAFVAADWGYDCVVQLGDTCLYSDENGDPFPAFCNGSGMGCVVDDETAVCQSGVGTCTPENTTICMNNQLMLACAVVQPVVLDCPSYGGSCSEFDEACINLPLGSPCGDALQCATGLICSGATDTTAGTCQ